MDQNIIAGVFAALWLAGSLPVPLRDWSICQVAIIELLYSTRTGRHQRVNIEVVNEWMSVEHETLMGETTSVHLMVDSSFDPAATAWSGQLKHPEHLHEPLAALPSSWNVQLYPYRNWFVPQPEGDWEMDCFIKPYLQRTTTVWTWHEGRVSCAGV